MDFTEKQGFTLTEIVIGIAIIGIIAAIAYPVVQRWTNNIDHRAISRQLHSDIALAKVEAARLDTEVVVTVTVAAGGDCVNNASGYVIFNDDGAGAGIAGNRIQDGGEQVFRNVAFAANSGACISNMTGFTVFVRPPGFNSKGLPLELDNTGAFVGPNTGIISLASTETTIVLDTTISVSGNISTAAQ